MIDFFTGCASLFSLIFNAAHEVEFFVFFYGLLLIGISASFFRLFYRGSKKL